VAKDSFGRSPLHYAALDNDVQKLLDLLAAGEEVNGFTPLHLAAQSYALEATTSLLAHGANVKAENKYGNQPLWTAVFESNGRGEVIKVLLANGADAWHKNHSGLTPIDLAGRISNYDISQFLADPETGAGHG
jgi:uncharacterized protein